LTDIFFFLP
jgi:hypothetical protein